MLHCYLLVWVYGFNDFATFANSWTKRPNVMPN